MATIEPYETAGGRRYRVRYRTPDHRQTDKRGFKTKRAAEEFLATVEVSKIRGDFVDPTRARVTVAEWAPHWYASQLQLKETTLSGYRQWLDKHVLPKWGKYQLKEIGHAEVQAWVSDLASRLSPSTVRQIYLVLNGLMKYAIRDGRLGRNPCEGVHLPRVTRKARGYLTHEQVRDLALGCGPEYADVVLFLAYTGLRWGEMAALKVGRVDMLRRRIDVSEAVSSPRGQLVWSTPKSHASRSVPFPSFLAASIAKRCEGRTRDELLFVGPDGGVLRSGNFRRRQFAVAAEACRERDPEFPQLTIHDLRHTAASLAISAGANVKAVQRMLGHASAAMTLDVYADLFDDDLESVATALDAGAAAADVGKVWAR
jgi:integrase